jgi:cytidylate kinase
MTIPVLTIDGPSGAGKGTVSRLVAKQLGWNYLDSGSIYRALAIALLQQDVDLTDETAIVKVAETMDLAFECGDELIVKLNGADITPQLGLETTGNTASIIAVLPKVRQALLAKQQSFRQAAGLVADGRDMGTVVFPDAQYKIYLTASVEERARRRYKQLKEKGIDANLDSLIVDIEARDRRDTERATAPLVQAENALYIESSNMSITAVIEEILNLIH